MSHECGGMVSNGECGGKDVRLQVRVTAVHVNLISI